VLAELEKRQDGERAAHDTIRLRRTTFRSALAYAVEEKLLQGNPMTEVKVKKHKAVLRQVDKRSVANPVQAPCLLQAARDTDPRLVAIFGLMYYAALRLEEAVTVTSGVEISSSPHPL
jgi:site-specific recombinase XerC